MNSEKEFKDKLKDKLGSKEFRFDEANWEQARQLIDASREEKKRSILPFILFGLLFIGSGILGVYLLNSPTASANNLAVRSDNNVTPVAKTQIINTESSNEKNTTETKPEIQNTEVVTEKAQTKNDQPIDKDQAIKTNAKEVKANGKKERKTTATKTAKEGNIVVVAIAKTKVKKERITNAVANTKNKTRSVQPAEIKA
ncbi:MAG: hypothetical protein ABIP51_22455, partial [Bacteroidia bacterium]